jgi:hypothetical protein
MTAMPSLVCICIVQAQVEVRTLEQFYKLLNEDPDRAFYGYAHVAKANDANAIDKLLVTDSLFRSQDLSTRKKYVALVDGVKDNGGDVLVFSSLHVSGERMVDLARCNSRSSSHCAMRRMPFGHCFIGFKTTMSMPAMLWEL